MFRLERTAAHRSEACEKCVISAMGIGPPGTPRGQARQEPFFNGTPGALRSGLLRIAKYSLASLAPWRSWRYFRPFQGKR
ncbi:hypothetical protein RCIA55 [Methanocella arvoryzae MRE50]|uniref:Uncharacterized protein n=1 Tax=Methanocella arvoryzae (strain DSM 22066 / NBRC 105507 / MRE50) TaxID=351160 RepID=Q0W5M0_METAR|nr:hypothetical protein RCIA55 [Methanocella arvoryzae MRE50]